MLCLPGDNGILTRGAEAKERTLVSQEEEVRRLTGLEAATNINGTTYKNVKIPSGFAATGKDGENEVADGLVITDSAGNEYVWIEVPNDGTGPDYTSVASSIDYTNIEEALIAYAGFSKTGSDPKTTRMGFKDEWYDSNSHTYNEATGKWYKYDGTEETDTSYAKNLNDKQGCGLTYNEYKTLKQAMLTSIYTNGGFWIGRYEAGMEGTEGRVNGDVSIDGLVAKSQKDLIPIYYVKCREAQTIASRVSTMGNTKSSLMFGLQWDLVIKYLELNGTFPTVTGRDNAGHLKADSSAWGNYTDTRNVTLTSTSRYTPYMKAKSNGQGYDNTFNTWFASTEPLGSIIDSSRVLNNANMPETVLLTTGASETLSVMNIYDLAGNEFEWTLEHATSGSSYPCATRGGGTFRTYWS